MLFFTAALNKAKQKAVAKDVVNRFTALGMPEKTAAAFSTCLIRACRKSGCTEEQMKQVAIRAQQIIMRDKVDETDVKSLTDLCPALVTATITHFKYGTHRALIRNAANGGFTATKFIEVVMRRF